MQYEETVALLPDYLNDRLSQKDRQWLIKALQESEALRMALTTLEDLQNAQKQWVDEEVPNWHRTAFAARIQHKPTHWSNWFSLATSMVAIFLVVFRIQIVSNTDGYQISFGEKTNNITFRKQAKAYFDHWQDEQSAYLDHRLLEFANQQVKQNQQVMTTVLEYNRDQLYQDLNQLTHYLLQQRNSDRVQTQSQYKRLYDSQSEYGEAINNLYASIKK